MNRRMSSAAAAGGNSIVTPPSKTTQSVTAGATPAAKTFGAFGDADGIVASYASAVTSAVGSTSASGSGLGAYTYSGHANGDGYVHSLNALDAGGSVLATAVHVVDIAPSARELAWTVVNLTDGWTLVDPDSLVDSIAHAAGFNVVTWNELGSGSADMVPINSGNFRGPRWYKLLQLDGTQIVSDDLVMLQTRHQNNEAVDDFHQAVVMGACIDPTSTLLTTIQGVGGVYQANSGANPAYGAWTVNAATSSTNASNHHGIVATIYGSLHVCGSTYVTLDSSGDRVNSGSRNATGTITSGQSVYLMVGFGCRGNSNTISADDQSSVKHSYRVTTVVNT